MVFRQMSVDSTHVSVPELQHWSPQSKPRGHPQTPNRQVNSPQHWQSWVQVVPTGPQAPWQVGGGGGGGGTVGGGGGDHVGGGPSDGSGGGGLSDGGDQIFRFFFLFFASLSERPCNDARAPTVTAASPLTAPRRDPVCQPRKRLSKRSASKAIHLELSTRLAPTLAAATQRDIVP
jgi:hypothetical protein